MSNVLSTNKVFDLNSLDFEYAISGNSSFYWANLEEIDGNTTLVAIYDFEYLDGVKASLACGDPHKGVWAHSSYTRDWPVLDKIFGGRVKWQNFLNDRAEEESVRIG